MTIGPRRIKYLISFVLPRFCNQSLRHSRKARFYPGAPDWVGKLDTIVHELYHIDPEQAGLRRVKCADGSDSERAHGPHFYQDVARMVTAYLASRPDPALLGFLEHDFNALDRALRRRRRRPRSGTSRRFRSATWNGSRCRRLEPLVRIERLKPATQPEIYTEDDLHIRAVHRQSTRRLTRKGQHRAA